MNDYVLPPDAGTPLTAPGQAHYLRDENLRSKVSLLPSGTLLIAKGHNLDPQVRSYISLISRHYQDKGRPFNTQAVDISVIVESYKGNTSKEKKTPDIQRFAIDDLFTVGVKMEASDIHIDIDKTRTEIKFGVNDVLVPSDRHQSPEFGETLCRAIYAAMTDIAEPTFEQMTAQDAKIGDKNKLPKGLNAMRIGTTPTAEGSLMTLRLIYENEKTEYDMESLGFSPQHAAALRRIAEMPLGMNIFSGPTGSGKSTALQHQLSLIMIDCNFTKNLLTIEDPPEYKIKGAKQIPKGNRTWAKAIIATLRLAPKILMIGEQRDPDSAAASIDAAMTGHQVWTTLHANTAFLVPQRLRGLQIEEELMFDSQIVTSLTCQRLIPALCPKCRIPFADHVGQNYRTYDVNKQAQVDRIKNAFPTQDIYVRNLGGCPHCENRPLKGIVGRALCAEVVETTPTLMHLFRYKDRRAAMRYWQDKLDGVPLLDHAKSKIQAGIIDPFMAEKVVGKLDYNPYVDELHDLEKYL